MKVETTALGGTLLWMLSYAGGTARQVDMRLTVRDRIGVALREAVPTMMVDEERGAVRWPSAEDVETALTIELSAVEIGDLYGALGDYHWPQVTRSIADKIRALPTWLKTLHDHAVREDAARGLPKEMLRRLAEEA